MELLTSAAPAKGINEFLRTYRAYATTDQLFRVLRARFLASAPSGDGKAQRVRVLAIINLVRSLVF